MGCFHVHTIFFFSLWSYSVPAKLTKQLKMKMAQNNNLSEINTRRTTLFSVSVLLCRALAQGHGISHLTLSCGPCGTRTLQWVMAAVEQQQHRAVICTFDYTEFPLTFLSSFILIRWGTFSNCWNVLAFCKCALQFTNSVYLY